MAVPIYLQSKYVVEDTGKCLAKYYFDTDFFKKFMFGYAIFCFLIGYLIPVAFFVVLYTKIVWTIRQRRRSLGKFQQQLRILKLADQNLTRTGMAVAIVFIISLSWGCWYYILGKAEVVPFKINSPVQIVGVFLSTFNSCVNPFIYSASLPIFRKSLKRTLQCGNTTDAGEPKDTETHEYRNHESHGYRKPYINPIFRVI